MFVPAPPETRFAMIQDTLSSYGNTLSVSELCRIANVSRSGYYRWVAAEPSRKQREAQDQSDFALILQAYNYRGYAKGARSIYMRLLHLEPPVCMNIKKIWRIMNKYGLKCPVRKANPHRRMLNAMRTSHTAPNLLQRKFRESRTYNHSNRKHFLRRKRQSRRLLFASKLRLSKQRKFVSASRLSPRQNRPPSAIEETRHERAFTRT